MYPLVNGILSVKKDSIKSLSSEISEDERIAVISMFNTCQGLGPDDISNFHDTSLPTNTWLSAFFFNRSMFPGISPKIGSAQGCRWSSRMVLLRKGVIAGISVLSSLFEKLENGRLYKHLDGNGLHKHQCSV